MNEVSLWTGFWPFTPERFAIWVGAILTLCIYSFLYRDNPFYKFAEHLLVGVSAGYWALIYWNANIVGQLLVPVLRGGVLLPLVPGVLGLLMFTRFFPRFAWISRYAIAFYVGGYAGLAIPSYMQARVLAQVHAAMAPTVSITAALLLIGLICSLLYFFFSREHKGVLGGASRIGIWFLMVGFGASFGYTVMARVSLLIGRMQFLFRDWLGLIR
ncbi:hypothetical protein AMJ39_00415 [candidate division TA06 bacterium DG_24]|jgi:hypothetical protein|uniref:Uncharacterized protein n=2 Tax=Bacteria division TA06 TaxID=1156500 RepID=A0A0S8G9N1_UNCT6|nr:MAG: hypothetical protein AMJ39_00415 [candidate division TA06 bacterium DG_24]KPK68843.1 MAG: hypothetical protein AMJ82_07165 [candidate division TA06 bacterium SM23_40]